jgi:hypothetical protein
MRLPTISALGLRRSCGSVSQAGNSTISPPGRKLASDSRSFSDSRPVAVTTSIAAGSPRSIRRSIMAARSGARRPSGSEKSLSRPAFARAFSNVEARESAVIKP